MTKTNDGTRFERGVSGDKNANFKPSVPSDYTPPPPAKVPPAPSKGEK